MFADKMNRWALIPCMYYIYFCWNVSKSLFAEQN